MNWHKVMLDAYRQLAAEKIWELKRIHNLDIDESVSIVRSNTIGDVLYED